MSIRHPEPAVDRSARCGVPSAKERFDVVGRRALVLGLGREGLSLARFLAGQGASVTVFDSRSPDDLHQQMAQLVDLPVRLVAGGGHPDLVADHDIVFVSPGIPETDPLYQAAGRAGLPIESMTTLFFALCPGPIVGITGSSGKTTTTGLIGRILREAERDVVVAGNIGDPMLDALPLIRQTTTVVLELSSFQLGLLRCSPHLAVVTNVTPNHLDRHGTMAQYIHAKQHIVEHQGNRDAAVLNATDPITTTFAAATSGRVYWFGGSEGAVAHAGWVGFRSQGEFEPVMKIDDIPLLGHHNVDNVLAALMTARLLGVERQIMAQAVVGFRPAPHRLQIIAERNGVRYIDDSIATSPTRSMVALRALTDPILLIAGGRDKRLPWDDFAELVVERVKTLFLIGEAAPLIEEAIRRRLQRAPGRLSPDAIHRCASLEEAVVSAGRAARPGDVVLLSPGCASYDMFANYEERGHHFVQAVEALHAA